MSQPPTHDTARPARDRLAFDRYDRWGLGALLGLFSAGAVAATVVAPLVAWARGSDLRVPFFSRVEVPALDSSGLRPGQGTYDLIVADAAPHLRVLDLLPGLGWLALIMTGSWIVLRVMGDVGQGDPFQQHNVRRLRILAGLLVLGCPVVASLQPVVTMAMLADLDLGDLTARAAFELPAFAMLVGVVVALLAEAFKAGGRLRDDVDGLV